MDLFTILSYIRDYLPIPVILAVIAVIMLVYGSLYLATVLEAWLEKKYNKQIKIFDHKKIWLSVFWCVVLSVALALGKFIFWHEVPYYWLIILGASTFLYQAFLKKTGIKKDDDD